MKNLLSKIRDLEQEITVFKNQNRRILECAVAEKKELERLAQKAKLYFNNSDLAYIVLDEKHCIVDVNETFTDLFAYTKEDILGLHVSTLFTSQKLYEKWWRIHLNEGMFERVSNLEYRLRTKECTAFWAELFGKKFTDEAEQLSIWSVRDISLRVKSRNTIAKLNLKYQKQLRDIETILDIIPVPVFIKDRYFRYIGCSRAFCAYFGLKKEDILGKTAFELYPIEIANRLSQKDQEMFTCNLQVYKITTTVPLSKQKVTLEIQKKRMMRNDVFDGFVGVFIDITEVEKQEIYLQNRIHEEVDKNLKIQKSYQEEMVRNAKFSAISQMAAGITHEINTPLTYVKGNFEMLKDSQSIQEGIERIESIIETMREVSQKSREQKEKVNLYELLCTSLSLSYNRSKQIVAIRMNDKIFDLSLSKSEYHFTCNVQKQRIEQVFVIILNNALDELVKIESFEKRALHVKIFEEDQTVVVRFCDNAGGIDAAILPRIFEPFESTKESSGIGIGLNIVQQIITQHAGKIIAYNENDGAVFEVRLPLAKESIHVL
ncbi:MULTISPECIES: PAS domain-containing sensor histidine kinase [unclassified Sulfurospirillum]|uniref:PAS domain-containing sensor histidine kinase n=1 Tax=unclassified Sulfurospirillum TaxID=2618290 RepID=UPI0005058B09|nr:MULTISPECIES: PAS domain-containing sensor histidine kinase [unclassified Sulfurospirillum]KFL32989.1 histidine kinase [Sulfurospirillum sp. SCADC]